MVSLSLYLANGWNQTFSAALLPEISSLCCWLQEVAAPSDNQQPPASSSWQQDVSASQPSHQHGDQHTDPLLASAAAGYAQFPDASSDAYPALVSGLPHVALEDPFMHEAFAQHAASSTMSQPWSPHHTEPAAAYADITVAAQVCQAPGHQSQGSTASPRAQSFAVDAELPVGMVASQAPAVPSSAYSNGHTLSSHQTQALGQNGLPGLADELFGWEQQVFAQPVEQLALEKAGEQQAMAESNGWHAEAHGSDHGQSQGTVAYAGLALPQYSETHELVQSFTAQAGSHELPAPEGQSQDVPVAHHPSRTNALPGLLVSQSAEPLFLGKKRQLGDCDDGRGAQDSIVAKKPCLAMSGSV